MAKAQNGKARERRDTLMKTTHEIWTHYLGKWALIIQGTPAYCRGYLDARLAASPRNAYRLRKPDGTVIYEYPAVEHVSIGQVAGFPTAEQYEHAAQRALEKAAAIRKQQEKKHEGKN